MSNTLQEVVFNTSGRAYEILYSLRNIIKERGFATVSDYYDMVGVSKYSQECRMFGWSDLNDAKVICKTGLLDTDIFRIQFPNFEDLTERMWDEEEKKDVVNHPQHYISENGLETIDVIEAFTADLKGIEAVCTANIIKYICRWKHKNGLEDLKKAHWYLERLIKTIENSNN